MSISPIQAPLTGRLLLYWLILPAGLLTWIIVNPPHQIDMMVSHWFFQDHRWLAPHQGLFETVTHEGFKKIPIVISLFYLGLAVVAWWKKSHGAPWPLRFRRCVFILVGLLLSVLTVVWLKRTTGVACPWSLVEFDGTQSLREPVLGWEKLSGSCWPSGHAGVGFSLFILYFAWRDIAPRLARFWFCFALVLGVLCSVAQIVKGAHFLSHTVVTMLIDWLICALLYVLWYRHWVRDCT